MADENSQAQMKAPELFDPNTELGKDTLAWWQGLENNKGQRAELRRCHDLAELACCTTAHQVYRRFFAKHQLRLEPCLLVIGLLARVRHHSEQPLAQGLAQQADNAARAAMSELRFRRLLQSHDAETYLTQMRRAIGLMKDQANIYDLARISYWWQFPNAADQTRTQLAYAYYEHLAN